MKNSFFKNCLAVIALSLFSLAAQAAPSDNLSMTQAEVNGMTDATVKAAAQWGVDQGKLWPTQADGIERPTDTNSDGKQRLYFTPQKLTAADCLPDRHWSLVGGYAGCVCNNGIGGNNRVSNDNPGACIPPPPPPAYWYGNSSSLMGGALACDELGCLMTNGTIRGVNGQTVGSFKTNSQGNIVASIDGIHGPVTFNAGGGASYNSSTGGYQTSNNIGGVISGSDAAYNLLAGTNNLTVTNNAGTIGISTASGNWLDVATGQVRNAAGYAIGMGTTDINGIGITLNDGSTGTLSYTSTVTDSTIGAIAGFTGAFVGAVLPVGPVNP